MRGAAITIVPYRDNWPQEFAAIAARLRVALGDDAVRIDHIGSTSVPGLAAKDLIDVQVTVRDFGESVLARIAAAGFVYRPDITRDHRPPRATGPESDWEKRFFKAGPGEREANIHIRAAGRANQRYPLLFRDYLRAHTASADAYAELKRRLAAQCSEDRIAYTDIKDPACDLILLAAEEWAAATGWSPL